MAKHDLPRRIAKPLPPGVPCRFQSLHIGAYRHGDTASPIVFGLSVDGVPYRYKGKKWRVLADDDGEQPSTIYNEDPF